MSDWQPIETAPKDGQYAGPAESATAIRTLLANLDAAANERQAQIVKWLRDQLFGDDMLDIASLQLADAIERGDHLPKAPETTP